MGDETGSTFVESGLFLSFYLLPSGHKADVTRGVLEGILLVWLVAGLALRRKEENVADATVAAGDKPPVAVPCVAMAGSSQDDSIGASWTLELPVSAL